jgi:hypothetical protein
MPLVCRNRPNRSKPRVFTTRDAARIVCYLVERGVSEQEIKLELSECIDTGAEECERERQRVGQLESALREAAAQIETDLTIYAGVVAAVAIVAIVARFVPAARPAGLALAAANRAIQTAQANARATLEAIRVIERARLASRRTSALQ